MSLKELDSCKQSRNKKFSIDVPKLVVTDRLGSKRTDEEVLPLSLEDNSTIAGTMSILTELRQMFNLPEDQYGPEYLPVDNTRMEFDYKTARTHFELLNMQYSRQSYMANLEQQLRSNEKEFDEDTTVSVYHSVEDVLADSDKRPTTLENEQRLFMGLDKPFWRHHRIFKSRKLYKACQQTKTGEYL